MSEVTFMSEEFAIAEKYFVRTSLIIINKLIFSFFLFSFFFFFTYLRTCLFSILSNLKYKFASIFSFRSFLSQYVLSLFSYASNFFSSILKITFLSFFQSTTFPFIHRNRLLFFSFSSIYLNPLLFLLKTICFTYKIFLFII